MINLRNDGDLESVQKDAATMLEILKRQGMSFTADCIAEYFRDTAEYYSLAPAQSKAALDSVLAELKSQTLERI